MLCYITVEGGGGHFFIFRIRFFFCWRSSLANYCKHFHKRICRGFISPVGYFLYKWQKPKVIRDYHAMVYQHMDTSRVFTQKQKLYLYHAIWSIDYFIFIYLFILPNKINLDVNLVYLSDLNVYNTYINPVLQPCGSKHFAHCVLWGRYDEHLFTRQAWPDIIFHWYYNKTT